MAKNYKDRSKLYMAKICGYTEVVAFSSDLETAKSLALKKKESLFPDDEVYFRNNAGWTWENVSNYYGALTEEITDGLVLVDG